MIFDNKYPDATTNTEIPFDGDTYFKSNTSGYCWACNRITKWVSLSFLAHLCSEECATEKWNEYFEAMRGDSNNGKGMG